MQAFFSEHAKKSGLYRIRNLINGRKYLGTATVLRARLRDHEAKLRRGAHFNRPLQEDFNHYGEDAFRFEVLALIRDPKDREEIEQDLIQRAFGPGCYNLTDVCPPIPLGVKRSPETRAKMSAAQRGKLLSPETKARISASLRGMKPSSETLQKLSLARTGSKRTLDTRRKMSENHFWKKLPLGEQRRRAQENGARLRAANLGRKASSSTRAKMSESRRGNTNASGNAGRVQSPEWVAKRVAARKATLEAKKRLTLGSF